MKSDTFFIHLSYCHSTLCWATKQSYSINEGITWSSEWSNQSIWTPQIHQILWPDFRLIHILLIIEFSCTTFYQVQVRWSIFSITKMMAGHLRAIFTFRPVRVSCLSGAFLSPTGGESGLQTLLYYILFSMSGWWSWADLIMMLISEWVKRAALKSWLTGEPIYSQSTQSTPYPLLIRQEYLDFVHFLTLYQTLMLTGVRSESLLPRYLVC